MLGLLYSLLSGSLIFLAGSPSQLRCHLLVQAKKAGKRASRLKKRRRLSTSIIEVKESQDGEGTTEEIALLFALVGVPPRGCCGCVLGGRLAPKREGVEMVE